MLSPDPSACLLAFAGEEIMCPDCGVAVLRFEEDSYQNDVRVASIEGHGTVCRPAPGSVRGALRCCLCGRGVDRAIAKHPTRRAELAIAPQLLIRSGSWTGWRMLGGE